MDLESRAAVHRHKLVKVLRDRGITDPVILAAFAEVPRHRFVERFWVGGFGYDPTSRSGYMRVLDDDIGEDDLAWVYAPDVALLGGPAEEATTSLSAPFLIAGMLDELDLAPGMTVLEIGAGSGYHAALMAALVGPSGSVVTVDIDTELAERTRARLDSMGYPSIAVIAADGVEGVAGRTFDRIVATVGCVDIAPTWRTQLHDRGSMVVPLLHGAAHPRVRLSKASNGWAGRIIGYSGFVSIQGAQRGRSPWRRDSVRPSGAADRHMDLPEPLRAALSPPDPARPRWNPAEWALGFYIALRDRRATFNAGIADEGSFGHVVGGRVYVGGPHGERLGAELTALAADWLDLGRPGLDRYTTTFEPLRRGECELRNDHERTGPWGIGRLDYLQTVVLH